MRVTDLIRKNFVAERRVRVPSDHLAGLIPRDSMVLDVDCGDGPN